MEGKSNLSDETQPLDPSLRASYEANSVSFAHVVRAAAMRDEADAGKQAIGDHDYPLLLKKFHEKHPGAQILVQEGMGIGVCLHSSDNGDLELVAIRTSIRFHWETARAVQKALNELDDDALRWLRPKERRRLSLRIYGAITQLQAIVAIENRRHDRGKIDDDATTHLEPELASLRPHVANLRAQLNEEAERAAQVRYALGMAIGTAVLAFLCFVGGVCFLWQHVPAVYGIGAIAGGAGACLSVFQRLTTRRLQLDYRTDPSMLVWFGGLRPFVGAVAGTISFCVVKAGLISNVIVIPTEQGMLLAFVAFLAFLASFSERFFQDMMRIAQPSGISGSAVEAEGYEPALDTNQST